MNNKDEFSYYHTVTVRYRDLDPQAHVNNAVYLTYLENARLGYYQQVGIFDPQSGSLTGMVVARNEIDYLAPITLGEELRVGLRIERLGIKSLTFAFLIESLPSEVPVARGKSVMVAYDNDTQAGIPIPDEWRRKITAFEET